MLRILCTVFDAFRLHLVTGGVDCCVLGVAYSVYRVRRLSVTLGHWRRRLLCARCSMFHISRHVSHWRRFKLHSVPYALEGVHRAQL